MTDEYNYNLWTKDSFLFKFIFIFNVSVKKPDLGVECSLNFYIQRSCWRSQRIKSAFNAKDWFETSVLVVDRTSMLLVVRSTSSIVTNSIEVFDHHRQKNQDFRLRQLISNHGTMYSCIDPNFNLNFNQIILISHILNHQIIDFFFWQLWAYFFYLQIPRTYSCIVCMSISFIFFSLFF